MLARVLLALHPPTFRASLQGHLSRPGVMVEVAKPGRGLWHRVLHSGADLALLSRSRIPDPPGDSIRQLRETPERPEIVVFSDTADLEDQATLLAAGCHAVLPSRLPAAGIAEFLGGLLDRRSDREIGKLRASPPTGEPRLSDFVSSSPAMQAFMAVVRQVIDSSTSLLVLGETGVGKERLARAIHAGGRRAAGPFVVVNCAALPEGLLESELFGHEEGAFTGATRSRRGRFEQAHGGTLFLDEIGEMPLHLQVKLLTALQEHEIQPVGAERTIQVDVRVVAASNRDLEREVESGNFRRDLYYRLGVVVLTVPVLRERREDIPSLAESYVAYYRAILGREVESIDDDAMEALVGYHWPGNVRELMNVIERAVLLCRSEEITLADLPATIARHAPASAAPTLGNLDRVAPAAPRRWLDATWKEVRREVLAQAERAYLTTLLEATDGRIGETARRAGMDARSLYQKMRQHGLRKEDYRTRHGH